MRPMTEKQVAMLQHLADGYTNKQVSLLLGISENTVRASLRNLYVKIGAGCRAHAVAIGFREGWLK